jgi:tetratricopeptide (TPR) repeat protein
MSPHQTLRGEKKRAFAESAAKLARGEITLAEYSGVRREALYEAAKVGYRMLNNGRLDEARTIYRGLVAADPYDSVFRCHLAATYLRAGEVKDAVKQFDVALRLNVSNVEALAGRGESHLALANFPQAIKDLSAAVSLDPEGRRASTLRARALLLALRDRLQ